MNNMILAACAAALASVASVEAGIFTYSAQDLTAGISSGGAGDEATFNGLTGWYGSRAHSEFGFLQFASIESSLMDNQFSVTARAFVNATSPGYGGYDAYASYELDFTVTEDAIATIYVDLGNEMPQGSNLSIALSGPGGSIYSAFGVDETVFNTTLLAGTYRMIALIWTTAPSAGDFSNESWLTVSVNAIPVPGPAGVAVFTLLGLAGSRRRVR